MILTYKYRIKGKRSIRLLKRQAWAINQVWNYCVSIQKETQYRYRNGSRAKWLGLFDLIKLTKGTSKNLCAHAQSIQQICHQFVESRNQHKRCPKFRKSNGSKRSLGWIPFTNQNRKIIKTKLGLDAIKYNGYEYHFFGSKRRPLPDAKYVKGGCFAENARGQWFVCLQVEVAENQNHGENIIGIDLGLKSLLTTSDGVKVDAPQTYRKYEEKLAVAQRSGNKKRTKAIHQKIKNIRHDHLHKISAQLIKENKEIYVGNIDSAKLAKTRMSKSVYDVSWSTLRNMLCYKASRHGVEYVEVDESFTTQTCSSCGKLPPERPKGIAGLGIREWKCSFCGAIHDRDVNAAKNILVLGLSAKPRVDESRVAYGR